MHELISNTVVDELPLRKASLHVCIVGNAQTKAMASKVHHMWHGKFNSYWYIWDEAFHSSKATEGNIHFFQTKNVLTRTEGIEVIVDYIFINRIECEYIFTHDDDLEFRIRSNFTGVGSTIADVLLRSIIEYRPAIASFPWEYGDHSVLEMNELAHLYNNVSVTPLTGFDSAITIYHRSIIQFFIPFSPRGEAGFHDRQMLSQIFIEMFAYMLFENYAIRLNMFEYTHLIGTGKLQTTNRLSHKKALDDRLAYVPLLRHPNEHQLYDEYRLFLMTGLKDLCRAWGRTLSIVSKLKMPQSNEIERTSFDGLWFLERLHKVYDIRHEGLLDNKFLTEQFSSTERLQLIKRTDFKLRIILFTFYRPSSFKRLWRSITTAHRINRTIKFDIHVDMNYDCEQRRNYIKYLYGLQSVHGDVRVKTYSIPLGMRGMMMEAWYPTDKDEYAMFLDDDVELSPYFLQYTEKLILSYFYSWDYDRQLFGISLYNQHYNEVIEEYFQASNDTMFYKYQMPQLWGAFYDPRMWKRFLAFLKTDINPVIPKSYTNRWVYKTSWKKYLLRFMCEEGGYLIYPNFLHNFSMSTTYIEDVPYDQRNSLEYKELKNQFLVPLIKEQSIYDSIKIDSLNNLSIYNVYQQQVKSVKHLRFNKDEISTFDFCTMILTVYDRINTTLDRIRYYEKFPYLSSIVIVWNNQNVDPVWILEMLPQFTVPVHILKMKRNSLNNRFYPHKQIKTDCIINMDDDWDMPYEHMSYAVELWRGQFFNNVVSYSHQGRNHMPIRMNGTFMYIYNSTSPSSIVSPFYSIALPPGFVYHRRYLYEYSFNLPNITRHIVDRLQNCDDILFNFMIANQTKQGPVFVHVVSKSYTFSGLWHRPTHVEVRSFCLNKFAEIFGGMPLRYTTSMFIPNSYGWIPERSKHIHHADLIKIK